MATIVKLKSSKKNSNESISFKAIVRYKGVFLTKTFQIKGNQEKTTKKLAENWAHEIEQKIEDGTYRKEHAKSPFFLL